MSGISTHVLDMAIGRPADGVVVVLEARDGSGWRELARGATDADGRIGALLPGGAPAAGEYRLRFDTAGYFAGFAHGAFYPEVVIHVLLDPGTKYHLPLLLSPYGYSTYRGS